MYSVIHTSASYCYSPYPLQRVDFPISRFTYITFHLFNCSLGFSTFYFSSNIMIAGYLYIHPSLEETILFRRKSISSVQKEENWFNFTHFFFHALKIFHTFSLSLHRLVFIRCLWEWVCVQYVLQNFPLFLFHSYSQLFCYLFQMHSTHCQCQPLHFPGGL